MKPRLFLSLILVFAGLGISGCATVQPWQRGYLTDYTMRQDRDELHANMNAHMYFSREGSTGGRGIGGGGCGCN